MTSNYYRVGGLSADVYDGFEKDVQEIIDTFPGYFDVYEGLLTKNTIWLQRTVGNGVISAEDAIDAAGLRPEIERALATLPIDFRAAVVLSDLEGMSLPEVAETLNVPIGTVKSRVFRGRRLLAERLGNQTPP